MLSQEESKILQEEENTPEINETITEEFFIEEIFSSFNAYTDISGSLRSRLAANYENRKNPIILKFPNSEVAMTLGRLYLNILLLRPFAEFGEVPKENELFNGDTVTQDSLERFFNFILNRFKNHGEISFDDIRDTYYNSINELCDVGAHYNVNIGNSISLTDIIRLEEEDPEFDKLTHQKVKPGQYSEIESQFKDAGKKIMKYFKEHKNTELHPFVASETGLNSKQFCQAVGFIGLKPDMDGSVIPVSIQDNFLHGLKGIESYYIVAKGCRKALCTNNKMTKRSGYLTRKLELSNIDHYHDNNIFDCGTKHFVIFNVNNERKLRQIVGRHYYDIDEAGNKISELKTVSDDSKELVGKKIGLRSPVCCCGKSVCATCYGRDLSAINKDINTGLSGTLKLTEPLTQRLLSAKHLLSTKTDKVEWGETFNSIFNVNMNTIYFKEETDCTVSFQKPTSDDYDEDEEAYGIFEFDVLQTGSKKSVHYKSPVKLFVNNKFLPDESIKNEDSEISISSKSISENDFVFSYQAKNNELTKSLQSILDLIENTDHLGITNYHDFVNKFDDLLIENDLDYINSIHIEMISSVLIRDQITGKRLDFSKDVLAPYNIIRVSKSIMDGPIAVSLSFERLNDQLIDLKTYEKTKPSIMDALFS